MISEFSLFLFTLLGGMAAGASAVAPFFPKLKGKGRALLLPLVCLILLAFGGLALLLHLGHPERMLFAFTKPSTGIALEGYAMVFFGLVLVLDLGYALSKGRTSRVSSIAGFVAGLVLSCAMAYAYFSYTAVPAWHFFTTIPLFVVGNLSSGMALYVFFIDPAYKKGRFRLSAVAIEVLLAISLIGLSIHFYGLGFDALLVLVGVVLLILAVLLLCTTKLLVNRPCLIAAMNFALVIIGLGLARYAFYAVV